MFPPFHYRGLKQPKRPSRRRKVRCNEQRPRCSHCERLNLQCIWRPLPNGVQFQRPLPTTFNVTTNQPGSGLSSETTPTTSTAASVQNPRVSPIDGSFNDLFNYASFMWDPQWQSDIVPRWREPGYAELPRYGQRQGVVSLYLLELRYIWKLYRIFTCVISPINTFPGRPKDREINVIFSSRK